MRQRLGLGALLAATLAACGGSSSETPPPLQPDPVGFRYAPTPPVSMEESDAGVLSPGKAADETEKSRRPSGSTWGSVPAKH
jgi:hypothetical protein